MKTVGTVITCLILFGTGWVQGYAQKLDLRIYSVNDGLPQQQVGAVSQDTLGFMWFGTTGGGMVRFDGLEFTQYTTRHGLRDNIIYELFHDSDNRLWVSTDKGGVAALQDDTLRYQFVDEPLDTLVVYNIEEIDGKLWFCTYGGGLFSFNGTDLEHWSKDEGLAHNIVWDIHIDSRGDKWIATHEGVSVIRDDTVQTFTPSEGLSGWAVYEVFSDSKENIWLATSEGVTRYSDNGFSPASGINKDEPGYIYDIEEDECGNIWFASASKGLYRYDGTSITHYTRRNGLSSNSMYEIFKDRNGLLWFATDENGVNLLRSHATQTFDYTTGLQAEEILGLFKAENGTLWIGTENGIRIRKNGEFVPVSRYPNAPGQPIWDFTELPNGHILSLADDNTIYEFDGSRFVDFTSGEGLDTYYTYEIFADDEANIWIATSSGLVRYDGTATRTYSMKDGLADNLIWDIYRDNRGVFWLGTENGLSRFNGDSFINYRMKNGLPHNQISHITQDNAGNLWLGTGGGISRVQLDAAGKVRSFENFNIRDELLLEKTQFLAFDGRGFLWHGTNAGIHRLDMQDYSDTGKPEVAYYGFDDRGQGFETTHKGVIEDDKDRLWMGTTKGVIIFDPKKEIDSKIKPKVYISDVGVNVNRVGHPGLPGEDTGSKLLLSNLNHNQNNLSFGFVGLDYRHPGRAKYQYRLAGFDKRWSALSDSRRAVYTNLEPGKYTFKVRARNGRGYWSPVSSSIAFTIHIPYWETWWFYVLVAAGLVGLAYGLHSMRINYLERKKLRYLVEERTSELKEALQDKEVLLREVHHRIKNNLAVISGLLELQMDQVQEQEARRALVESQLRVHSISTIHEKIYQNQSVSAINIKSYIHDLVDIISFTLLKQDADIDIHCEIEEMDIPADQGIPCGLILNELVSNAVEHAFGENDEGVIDIRFWEKKDTITLRVNDNGKGLPEGFEIENTMSLGLSLVESLAQQLKGEFSFRQNNGTEFTVEFPKSDNQ